MLTVFLKSKENPKACPSPRLPVGQQSGPATTVLSERRVPGLPRAGSSGLIRARHCPSVGWGNANRPPQCGHRVFCRPPPPHPVGGQDTRLTENLQFVTIHSAVW